MVQLAQAVARIISPVLAGFLVAKIQVWGVILLDFATFLLANSVLLFVRIPKPEASAEGRKGRGSLSREVSYGWTYLAVRPGLMGVLVLSTLFNLMIGVADALFAPMMLAFTTTEVFGTVMSVGGSGMLAGGFVMSIWGGPKRRVFGMLGFMFLVGLSVVVCGLRPLLPLVTASVFAFFFCIPIALGSNQALWQGKVAPDVQGRVFATRNMIAGAAMPVAYLLAGPLADQVFEPLLSDGGLLGRSVGQVIGVGPGRGMALTLAAMGVFIMAAAVGGLVHPRVRLVERELPDVDVLACTPPAEEVIAESGRCPG